MLIQNANLVDVISGEIIPDQAVRTDKSGKISEIGKTSTISRSSKPGEEVLDLQGHYLFPGLISCHTHLSVVFPFSLTDPNEDADPSPVVPPAPTETANEFPGLAEMVI